MNTEASLKVDISTPEFLSFVAGVERICLDHIEANFPNCVRMFTTKLGFNCGGRFIRVSRCDYTKENVLNSSSAHCFIDRTNGDVLKAASWKTPAKGARGNIFDAQHGLGRMGPYGAAYNK